MFSDKLIKSFIYYFFRIFNVTRSKFLWFHVNIILQLWYTVALTRAQQNPILMIKEIKRYNGSPLMLWDLHHIPAHDPENNQSQAKGRGNSE